ncbi:MAG: metallopeptidase family protein [Anderseniella sp.]|jgi:predicted Zn-dependent protease with MMP-like domain|nr:metallopeptidase family protein [Anderseniella sp.]
MNSSFNSDSRWSHMRAPTAADLALLARKVWEAVPMSLRDLTGEIAIVIEEFPDDDTLDEVGAETPFDIMGLLRAGADNPPVMVIFRRAVLDYWVETGEELGAVLTHVMVHETAHHLDLSDEMIAQLEAELEAATPNPRTVQ